MSPARRLYRLLLRTGVGALRAVGLNVAKVDDYYSPLPDRQRLAKTRQRWDRPSSLRGLSLDPSASKRRLGEMLATHGTELDALPSYDDAKSLGYGPGFTRVDAVTLYLMLRRLKPRRYVEVGSGLSTYYAWLAVAKNRDEGHPCEMSCVDPYSGERVAGLDGVEVRRQEIQNLAPADFAVLSAGDVLFIDSTHVVKIDGDVPHLYLEIVPALSPGVVVHSHDVHFPFNVPHPAQQYVFDAKWPLYWTEAMLLQAFLSYNREFEVLLSVPYLRFLDEAWLVETLPGYTPLVAADHDSHCGSLWFRRRLEG